MIKCLDKDWGPKPFRSIDAWLSEKGFAGMVEERWKSYKSEGSAIKGLKEKLKLLKVDLKVWNRDVFGNLNLTKSSIVQEIKNFDRQDCNGQVGES